VKRLIREGVRLFDLFDLFEAAQSVAKSLILYKGFEEAHFPPL
jgi:hypothetical protein